MIKLTDIAHAVITEQSRTKNITRDEAIEMIRKNCRQFDPNAHGPIYRGINFNGGFGFVDPSKSVRRSANTKNFYTLLIDNSPRWKAYPKRSQSIICTNDVETAEGYGDPFYIVPFDGSRIGICPSSDIWYSFDFKIDGMNTLHDLNTSLSEVAKKFGLVLKDDNYRNLAGDLAKLGDFIQNDPKAATEDLPRYTHDFVEPFLKSGLELEQFLHEMLDPKRNGFKVEKWPSRIPRFPELEVWTDGPSIMIYADMKDEIFKEVYNK